MQKLYKKICRIDFSQFLPNVLTIVIKNIPKMFKIQFLSNIKYLRFKVGALSAALL